MNKEKLSVLINNYKEAKAEKIFAEAKVGQALNYMSKKMTNDEKLCFYNDLEERHKYNNECNNKFKETRCLLVIFLCGDCGDDCDSSKYSKIRKMIDEYDDVILDILSDLCETSQIDNITRDLENILKKYN